MTRLNYSFLAAAIIILLGSSLAALYWLITPEPTEEPAPVSEEAVPEPEPEPEPTSQVIGQSVEGRDIVVHTYGNGDTHVVFVGGIHGGYEWNSTLLAYEYLDYIEANPDTIPEAVTIHIIPALNPDGLYDVVRTEGRFTVADIPPNDAHTTGRGRFNANDVDLNRNFGCDWAPESTWRGQIVSAGTGPFSEPEAAAFRSFIIEIDPIAAVFWHSRANAVFASECNDGPLPLTLAIMESYAAAANYHAIPVFDAYPITGDVEGWLASQQIAAITVELEGRLTSEWARNRAGITAMLETITSSQ